MRHTERLIAANAHALVFFFAFNRQREVCYHYLAVRLDRLDAFLKAYQKGTMEPADYGTVLATGVGFPTDDVIQEVEAMGFDHEQALFLDGQTHPSDPTGAG